MKTKKTLIFLLMALIAFSQSLFAEGAIEKNDNEKLIQVLSLDKTENGRYDLHGLLENGTDIIYHIGDDLKINFPVDEIKTGMYLYVEDTGIMTMSLPPQSPAIGIRNVTMAVKSGIIPFGKQSIEIKLSDVDTEDLFSAFSYAYGYLTTENFITSGIVFNAGYYAKGILDAWYYGDVEPFFSIEEMNGQIEKYVADILQQEDSVGEAGPIYLTEDAISSLPKPEELEKQFAYAYGYLITLDMLFQGHNLIGPDFASGALYALYDVEPLMSIEDLNGAIDNYNGYLYEQLSEYISQIAAENLAQAEAFLDENGKRAEVTTLDSGVQIELISQDSEPGAQPTDTDSVVVDYTLTLLDGTVADKGEKVTFSLSSLIPGFTEAVKTMHVGDTIIAYIPPEMGYGENGAGELIAPNSLLTFTIYLDSIVEK